MNSLKSIVVLVAMAFTVNASAQMKIAHINSGELMEQMPQLKKIQDSLERVSNEYQSVLSAIEAEVTQKQKTWTDNPTENKTLLELREKEYQELVSRYQRTQQMAQQDVSKQQEDLLKPLIDDLKSTIISVAKEMGYDYVLDSTDGGGLIYGNPSHDLMVAVKKKMGIK
ncbi:MAG: OmpH family outer membrane protein [Flavobacteriales bacterium]|nr:OmpH family outer membrane protein [Flavobacteriales bacterium]